MAHPQIALGRLVSFNPSPPARVRQDPGREFLLLPMEAIGAFDAPRPGTSRRASDLLQSYSYVEPSDVAYAKVTPCFENGKGLDGGELDEPTFATSELTVLRPKGGLDRSFLSYVVQSARFRGPAIASMTGAGGLKRVDEQEMKRHKIWCPAEGQQRAIADFLDRETAEIDTFIADLDRLLRLSEEGARARIAGLLDSTNLHGARHTLLGRVVRVEEGQVDPRLPAYAERPLIAPNHIEPRSGRLLDVPSAAEQNAESGKYLVRPGQVVYSKIRPALMKCAVSPYAALCSADMYPLEPNSEWISSEYLLQYLLSPEFESFAVTMSDRVAMPKLNRDTLARAPIALPSLREQNEIVAQAQAVTRDCSDLRDYSDRAITLANERRAALISAAVTGQIDVTQKHRPVAEQLEDEVKQLS